LCVVICINQSGFGLCQNYLKLKTTYLQTLVRVLFVKYLCFLYSLCLDFRSNLCQPLDTFRISCGSISHNFPTVCFWSLWQPKILTLFILNRDVVLDVKLCKVPVMRIFILTLEYKYFHTWKSREVLYLLKLEFHPHGLYGFSYLLLWC